MVAVGVGLGGVFVVDLNRLDIHVERSLGVVGGATSPLNSTFAIGGVTTSPDTNANGHRGLGVTRTALSIGVVQGTNDIAVDGPGGGLLLPRHLVGVVNILGSSDGRVSSTVIGRSVALAEVVGLNSASIATQSFL